MKRGVIELVVLLVLLVSLALLGNYSFDNFSITGNVIAPGSSGCDYHDADSNHDANITLDEYNSYIGCYKTPGCLWNGNSIGLDYYISGFRLYNGGGSYSCSEFWVYPGKLIKGNADYEYLFNGEKREINWQNNYDRSNYIIKVTPSMNINLFMQGQNVTIEKIGNSDGDARVFTYYGKTIFNGTLPVVLEDLSQGHYFVEYLNDRSQFFIAPRDFEGSRFIGLDPGIGAWWGGYIWSIQDFMKPSYSRLGSGCHWTEVQALGPDQWDWNNQSNGGGCDYNVNMNYQKGLKVYLLIASMRPNWVTDDNDYNMRLANFVGNLTERYKGKIYGIEILNEPWPSCIDSQGRIQPRLPNTVM